MDSWRKAMLLFTLATAGMIAAQLTLAGQQGDALEMKKRIYSIRKETLSSLKRYTPPDNDKRAAMKQATAAFLEEWTKSGTPGKADSFAPLGFAVSEYREKEETFALIHEQEGRLAGGGLYLFRKPQNRRCEVLMAPHGFFDIRTGKIGVDAFFATKADALLLNSAHRYTGNREKKTDRFGTDLAHRDDNYYFAVFQALADSCSGGTFVQLHGYDNAAGFRKPGERYDVILSAGDDVGQEVQWAKRASGLIHPAMPEWKVATYGIEIGGALGGETNVHKKYLHEKAGMLFLHIEMSTRIREDLAKNKSDADRFSKCLDQLLMMKK